MARDLDDFDYTSLSVPDRIRLAHEILESVVADRESTPLTPDELAEIRRRVDALQSGREGCIPWSSLRDQFLAG